MPRGAARFAVAALTAAALTTVALPSAHAADAPETASALNAAIAASNFAYASGIVSDVRGVFPFDNNPAANITNFTAGVAGTDLFDRTSKVTAAWMSDRKGVAVSALPAAKGTFSVAQRVDSVFTTVTNGGTDVPKRVTRIVSDTIAAQGGNAASLVKRGNIPANYWDDFYRPLFTLTANPAAAVQVFLEESPKHTVTSTATADGGTVFTIAVPNDAASPITVRADARERIWAVEWSGKQAGWVKVKSYGDAVAVPDAAYNQIKAPVLQHALDYLMMASDFDNRIGVVKTELRAFAALGNISAKAIRKALVNVNIVTSDNSFAYSDYKARKISNGYQVEKTLTKDQRQFGTLCAKITAGKTAYKYRSCR